MNWVRRLRAYLAHPDPRVAACNRIALVVAWNQPLYPGYVRWFVGGDAWVACWTFLSTPFFLAVPLVARRHPLAGRAMLVGTGIANMTLSVKAFGTASGVEWFLLPCALIAMLAFRRRDMIVLLPAAGAALLFVVALHGRYGTALGHFTPADYRRFVHLNGWSVATLCLFVVWTLGGAARRERRSCQARPSDVAAQ